MANVTKTDNLNNWSDAVTRVCVAKGVNVSKINTHFVLTPSQGIDITKVNAYFAIGPQQGINITKVIAYFVLDTPYELPLTDTLSLSDAAVKAIQSYNQIEKADNLNAWLDNMSGFYEAGADAADSLVITDSPVSVLYEIWVGALTASLSDSLALKDGLIYQLGDTDIDIRLDDLANYSQDSVIISFVVFFNNNPVSVTDSLNSWIDAVLKSVLANKGQSDSLTLSDSIRVASTGNPVLSDTLSQNDSIEIFRSVMPIGYDDLNNWADSVDYETFELLKLNLNDSLNHWNDFGGQTIYRGTAFLSYIRRYLNDVQ